ncbi:peptidase S8 family protein [Metarhizium robertsii]|uniref:Peptidase S8 family protein n=1 Tax=Metarhizium robertsii TaxID=568076 RepID=A0A014NA69_9HYPO|nr:peptidase S8 family protein [Metarhizium robertsii]
MAILKILLPSSPRSRWDVYIVTLKQGISSHHVESHVNWARAMHDASLGRRALDLPRVEKTNDLDTIRKITDSPGVHSTARMINTTQESLLRTMSSRTPGLKPYRYDETAGKDTFAYVIDSGIHANHAEFGGGGGLPSASMPTAPADTGSGKATRLVSDTSLAALHIAGLALYLIATKTAAKLWARILALATKDKIANLPAETCSLLAYNGAEQAVSAGRGLGSS